MTCSIAGCSRPLHARDYCKTHYMRWMRRRDTSDPITMGDVVRLFALGEANTAWMIHAACKGKPTEMFFGEKGDNKQYDEAKAICRDCPVRGDCLDYAIETREKFGLWGGMSRDERKRYARANRGRVA